MTAAIVIAILALALVIVWVSCYRKAKKIGVIEVSWKDDEKSEETVPAPEVTPTESEKETTIVDDEPKLVEPPSLVVTASNTVAVEPIENPWANCKTVECEPKPIEELELKQVTKEKAKKERKPRKSQLERTEEAIAKLEGQISSRTALLKKIKKPVTKDERLNKWKASLKELKSTKKELVKASKPTKAKKTK